MTNTCERLFPQKPVLTRAELMAKLDEIQARCQAVMEPARLSGFVGPDGMLQLQSAMYNVRTLQCWLRRDAAEEASLESKLEASIEMVRSKNNCRQVGETE